MPATAVSERAMGALTASERRELSRLRREIEILRATVRRLSAKGRSGRARGPTAARALSIVPLAERTTGIVTWFGVDYDLRTDEGNVPGVERTALTVYKRHIAIGRIAPQGRSLQLTSYSPSRMDRRALDRIARAWFASSVTFWH